MARSYKEVLKELYRQRRQIERAITALEAIEREQPTGKHRVDTVPALIANKNGTTATVVPFVRPS